MWRQRGAHGERDDSAGTGAAGERGTRGVRGERDPRGERGERTDKTCASCGRRIEWRAAWAKNWAEVRYCSDACRARKVRPVDRALEESIRSMLAQRAHDATICPSEAARAVAAGAVSRDGTMTGEDADYAWRALLEPARRAARRLVASGEVEITQGGRVVDPSTAKGPIRVRRVR